MKVDIEGRVANTSLAASRPLLPLYEAIVNSIQAIEDAGQKKGTILLTLLRDETHLFTDQDGTLGAITGFEVSDNGIGFTEENFAAFNTSDTTYKANRGGKGVGRFLWLVAFREVEVESIYQAPGGWYRRFFRFIPKGDGIADATDDKTDSRTLKTTVRLLGFKKKYQEHCPKRPETIAGHVVEHCLELFLRADCPRIELHDPASNTDINLNRLFEQEIKTKSKPDHFTVKGHEFSATHVRLYRTHAKEHLSHYCAHDRVVQSRKLSGRLPNLTPRIQDAEGKEFTYAMYVESPLLDEHVNAERTTFAIDEDSTGLFPGDVTFADISRAAEEKSSQYLKPYTDPVRNRKRDRIDRFIATEAPMYRPILPYIDERIDRMDADLDDDGLDLELYRAYHDLAVSTKQEGVKLLNQETNTAETYEEFSARLEAYFSTVTDLNAADLARYVCQRKAVLDFLQKLLGLQADGKYSLEKQVHNIIFPMGKTSSDMLFEEHNLWLIDEKLAYHAFLASDKSLKAMAVLDADSDKEPDIIVFDAACAFVPSSEPPFPAVTLIEFKRPMRDDYSVKENPFVQVREYITLIRNNKARTPDGREILIPATMPFYCYIVCDIGQRLQTWAYDFELEKTPDGQGFFGFKRKYNAYFEVLSYTKMVGDAKKRNAIFFDKLALPSRISASPMFQQQTED